MTIQPVVNSTVKTTIASRIGTGEGLKRQGVKPTQQRRNVPRQTTAPRGAARRGGRGGGRVQRNPRTGPRKNVTAAELDADLDAYTNKV